MQLSVNKLTKVLLCGAMVCATLVGCHQTPAVSTLAYLSKGTKPLQHYHDVATKIAYPTETSTQREPNVDFAGAPRLIYDPTEDEAWDLSLGEAIKIALENGAIIKDDGSFGSPGNPLFANPNGVRTAYDVGILESGVLFGNRGVEAALADFDAQTTTTMTFGNSELRQNSPNLNLGSGSILSDDTIQFSTQVQKQLANAGTFTLQHDMNYSQSNTTRAFPSAFTGFSRATYQQPLLAGSGTEFTRIAGPIGGNLTGVSGVAQGVVIARINTDISLADFEISIASMIRDVENRYWDLHLFYQIFDAERAALESALGYVERLKDRLDVDPEQQLQAKAQYSDAVARVQNSLADIYDNESRLRRLMGLPPRGAEIIRPVDTPSQAQFEPNWNVTLAEALTRRPELRAQKWNIRSLELQLKAARSLVRPRLDLVAQAQLNAFGDQLIGDGDFDGGGGSINDSALESLLNGTTTAWNVGFQLAFPIGFRSAHTQVRNYEFRVRKARTVLAAQEMEISHQLHAARKGLDRWYQNVESNRERLQLTRRVLEEALISVDKPQGNRDGAALQNRVFQAHSGLRDALTGYHQSVIEYNKAMTELNFRKGSLLAESRVHLSESAWSPSAYQDALRRGWSRTYAKETSLKSSEPVEFTQQNPRMAPLAAVPQPRMVPNRTWSEPVPGGADEDDDEDDRESPELDPNDDPADVLGETVQRTGFTNPFVRPRQAVQKPQARRAIPVRPRGQGMATQLDQLERTARRTGDSKAG